MKPNNIHQILESSGFIFEQESCVWRPEVLPAFAYNDGDEAENYVLDVVKNAKDLSVDSLELSGKMKNWPSTYHLTSRRSNLLKPFQSWFSGKRILEIGCGCGAITRFLAESGAHIVSVEGSLRRAKIARQRCRELLNVDVICSPSDQLPDLGSFDGVMLIGVLEYARVFLGENGQHDLLTFCRQRMSKNGKLFVAIENKLGIKYFAGANEDHVGIPMFGINNSYTKQSVATFGRKELLSLLNENGFTDTQEYIPLPDYKLPVSVITPVGWGQYASELMPLAIESCHKDAQGIQENLFSVEQGTKNIWINGLAADLANSSFVIASQESQEDMTQDIAAYHYSNNRLVEFKKTTLFITEESGGLAVISAAKNNNSASDSLIQNIKSKEVFYSGNSLWMSLVDIVNRPDWTLQQLTEWAKEWLDALLLTAGKQAEYHKDTHLEPNFLDAVPFNAIKQNDGTIVFFDLEWQSKSDITLGYIAFRGIFHSLLRLTSVSNSQHCRTLNIATISFSIVEMLSLGVAEGDLRDYLTQESGFIALIESKNSDEIYNVISTFELSMRIVSMVSLQRQLHHAQDQALFNEQKAVLNEQQIVRQTAKLVESEEHITVLEKNFTELQLECERQNILLSQYAQQMQQILHSSSWKLSAPLRVIGRRLPFVLLKPMRLAFNQVFYFGQRIKVCLGQFFRYLYHFVGKVMSRVSRHSLMVQVKRNVRNMVRDLYYRLPERYKGRLLKMAMKLRPSWFAHHPAFTSSIVAPEILERTAQSAFISHRQDGTYHFSKHPDEYIYIPTACPHDLSEQLDNLARRPTFSIIVPIYNTPLDLLEKMVASVRCQWYPDWELILANDASPLPETKVALDAFNDPKIKVIHLNENQGIAGATNVAIDNATGEFIVFLDHDDELTEDCLFELALCINRDDPDFIYSDEDKFTPEGDYSQPHFKPDWSPDTMMGTMYTCHVACVRLSVAKQVGGLRTEFNGCQDWDFILRLTEITQCISHIPKVLYHWRIIPASVASDMSAKPYVLAASIGVRESALERRGLKGTVEALPNYPGYFRVNYALRDNACVSIIIPTRDNVRVLKRCIDSILDKSAYPHFEIIIIDNGSKDTATLAYLDSVVVHPQVTVFRHDAPFNFSELNNIGARQASGELLLFLNDDTEVLQADWLERMGGYAQLSHVGAVGAKLLYADGVTMQHAGVLNLQDGPMHAYIQQHKDIPGYFLRNQIEYNWLVVTGACLMVERRKFELIGGFNQQFPVAYNDVDLCMRLRDAGWYNVMCQSVNLIHHESVSRGLDHSDHAKVARLQRELRQLNAEHPYYFQYDPFYNINFAPNSDSFGIQK